MEQMYPKLKEDYFVNINPLKGFPNIKCFQHLYKWDIVEDSLINSYQIYPEPVIGYMHVFFNRVSITKYTNVFCMESKHVL